MAIPIIGAALEAFKTLTELVSKIIDAGDPKRQAVAVNIFQKGIDDTFDTQRKIIENAADLSTDEKLERLRKLAEEQQKVKEECGEALEKHRKDVAKVALEVFQALLTCGLSFIPAIIENIKKALDDKSNADVIEAHVSTGKVSFTELNPTKEIICKVLDASIQKNQIRFDVGDITKLDVECIVNAANHSLIGNRGVDGAIHRAAGPKLQEECRNLGGCHTGEAKLTGGYDLKARYVIHTVGPIYKKDDPKCAELLCSCYYNSLNLAKEHNIHSIAFPAISTGAYGYPADEAATIALMTICGWLLENPDYEMTITLSCYSQRTVDTYQKAIDRFHSECIS